MNEEITHSRAKVLFVDDEQALLDGIARSFRSSPFDVLTAQTVSRGARLIRESGVAVVVSDELMPGIRGSEFLEMLKEEFPGVVRIMLTGQSTFPTVKRAVNKGEVFRFFSKPYNKTELLMGILDAIAYSRDQLNQDGSSLRPSETYDALNTEHPGIFEVTRDEDGAIVINTENESN